MATLEAKLAELRTREGVLLVSIEKEEDKIRAVHKELASEDTELMEERRKVETQEAELQREMVRENILEPVNAA